MFFILEVKTVQRGKPVTPCDWLHAILASDLLYKWGAKVDRLYHKLTSSPGMAKRDYTTERVVASSFGSLKYRVPQWLNLPKSL